MVDPGLSTKRPYNCWTKIAKLPFLAGKSQPKLVGEPISVVLPLPFTTDNPDLFGCFLTTTATGHKDPLSSVFCNEAKSAFFHLSTHHLDININLNI
jgi:hypothetical protein